MNVNSFRQNLPGGGLRPSRYKIVVPFPAFANGSVATKKLSFLAEATTLPPGQMKSVSLSYMGRETKWAGDSKTYNSWSFTVIADTDQAVYNAFVRWQEGMLATEANVRTEAANAISGHQVDMELILYSVTGKPIYTKKMVGAFPIEVGQIDLNWGNADQVARFNVTVDYQYWTDLSTDGQST